MGELTGWERLGAAIVRRRIELGYHRRTKDFADRAGFSDQTLTNLERAKKDSYDPGTFVQLEKALLWEPGSAANVVGGHDPVELPIPEPEPEPEPELAQIDDAELVARLNELTAEVSRRLGRRRYTQEELGQLPTVPHGSPVPWERDEGGQAQTGA